MNLSKETVESLYFEDHLSIRQIVSRLGVGSSTIARMLQESPLRTKSEAAASRYEPLKLSGNLEELAYLVGIYLGDGCLVQSSRTELLDIACDAKYQGLIDRFTSLVSRVFGKAPALQRDPSTNCVHIRLYGTGISATLGMDLGPKNRRDLQIPLWIKDNEEFTRWCLRGLFETDGYIHSRRGRDRSVVVGFSNTNGSLLDEVQQLLYNLGYINFRQNKARIDCWQFDEAMRFITEIEIEKN